MKRTMLLLCTLVLLTATLPYALAQGDRGIEKFLLGKSVELTMRMDEWAELELYRKAAYLDGSSPSSLAVKIGEGNYNQPAKAMVVALKEGAGIEKMYKYGMAHEELSDFAYSKMEALICYAFASSFTVQTSMDFVSASAMLAANTSYLLPDGWNGNQIVILIYENDYASIVTFVKNENDIVDTRASFMQVNDSLQNILDSDDSFAGEIGEIVNSKKIYSSDELAVLLDKAQ